MFGVSHAAILQTILKGLTLDAGGPVAELYS